MNKGIKKSFVPDTVDALLDDWLNKLQPHYDKWTANKTSSLPDFLVSRSDDVAEDLLQVTDERAQKTSHTTAKKAYEKMRGGAKKNVIEAIPELARLIEKHLGTEAAKRDQGAVGSASLRHGPAGRAGHGH